MNSSNSSNSSRGAASVLAVVVARIGDTLLATPALRALRNHAGHLAVLAHPRRMEVLENLDFIDALGGITKAGAAWKGHWPSRRHDVAICYGRDAALLRYCMRVSRQTVAFDYPELRGMDGAKIRRVPVPVESSLHAVRERLLLAEAVGARADDLRLAYVVSNEERVAARAWLAGEIPGYAGGAQRLIGLQPRSFPTKAHRDWPVSNFVELARLLAHSDPHCRMVLLGDGAAAALAPEFEQVLPGRCVVAAGRFSLRQSAAVMSLLSLYVGVDTGPTHIAGALGIPMVALYHPAYPGRNLQPLENPNCIAIAHPATSAGSPMEAHMSGIGVDAVWNAARGLLAGNGPGAGNWEQKREQTQS